MKSSQLQYLPYCGVRQILVSSRSRWGTSEPTVEEEVGLAEHGQQRMMGGFSVLAQVVPFERALLLSVTLKDRRIQVQGVASSQRGPLLCLFLSPETRLGLRLNEPAGLSANR